MGPGTVRLQAAVEAVVYASAMTPLYLTGTSLGTVRLLHRPADHSGASTNR